MYADARKTRGLEAWPAHLMHGAYRCNKRGPPFVGASPHAWAGCRMIVPGLVLTILLTVQECPVYFRASRECLALIDPRLRLLFVSIFHRARFAVEGPRTTTLRLAFQPRNPRKISSDTPCTPPLRWPRPLTFLSKKKTHSPPSHHKATRALAQNPPPAHLLRLPTLNSRSASISRRWTHVRSESSALMASQLSSSVSVRLMPSLTTQSRCSSSPVHPWPVCGSSGTTSSRRAPRR